MSEHVFKTHGGSADKLNDITVCKFGGSSLADADGFRRVAKIISSDKKRKVVIVSAPGKRFPADEKVTDLLFKVNGSLPSRERHERLYKAFGRFFAIKSRLFLNIDLKKELERIDAEFDRGTEYVVSRGEYLTAKMTAEFLGYEFFDAEKLYFFDETGTIDLEKTRSAFSGLPTDGVVIPGFYGTGPSGTIKLFSRGGSDVSGSFAAVALKAKTYENHTDVSGVYPIDPAVFKRAKPIKKIGYRQLALLTGHGAKVVHKGAVPPLINSGVTLKILNTFRAGDAGTTVTDIDSRLDFLGVTEKSLNEDSTRLFAVFSKPRGYDDTTARILNKKGAEVVSFGKEGENALFFDVKKGDETTAAILIYELFKKKR
ncbi:MAG: hypothetical protein J5762_00330 [Clostridia bacterium]|nr:hypothetical protein [Clostridia bacterium]